MNGFILYKNGSFDYMKFDKFMTLKNSKVKAVLLEAEHPVFGVFYASMKPDAFKILQKYSKKIKLSYKFLDGILVDEEDGAYLFAKNVYRYTKPEYVISKIAEIIINEYIFNDCFWVHDSFYQYIYEDVLIKMKGRGKRSKKYTGAEFAKKFINGVIHKDAISFDMDNMTWKALSLKKYEDAGLVQVYKGMYFAIDPKIFTVGKYKLIVKILLIDDYEPEPFELNTKECEGKLKSVFDLQNIIEALMAKETICKLECYDGEPTYGVKTIVKFKSKKLKKKKYKFKKFVRRYFLDI